MALAIAAILFAVFVTNVFLGATGGSLFLTDVQEMIILFATSISFVVGILKREAAARAARNQDTQ